MNKPFIYALSLSGALHLALVIVLFLGDFTSAPKPTPVAAQMAPIQAIVVDQSKVDQQIKRLKKQKADASAAEKKRLRDIENKISRAKKKRAKEEARIKDLERQRKIKVKEKKKADAAAKKSKAQAAEAEKNRKKKVAEQKKAEKSAADAKAKRIKDKKAADKKAAADKKRKQKAAKERAEQELLLEQQMAEEMASRQKARKQQMMSEIQRYSALIKQTVQRHMIIDRSTMEGKSCKLTLTLAPSGLVISVSKGAGDRIVCDAAQKAIYKANTLPVSKDPEVFKEMRKLSIIMAPKDF